MMPLFLSLEHPLDLEPAFEVLYIPRTQREEDDGLDDGPPFHSGVLPHRFNMYVK